ncbi:MAG TPA: glycosyltransferase family 2 protein, partial [Candidatus Methylomirabilis sp.]|nr:glycosyltransferase family 2 protein [Candidatus Methylomirabilis sp.]
MTGPRILLIKSSGYDISYSYAGHRMKEKIIKNNKPRVSIGLPVCNGENYLKEALDSILAQTYTEFELIISDNASTDSTPRICQAYTDKDPRIRYYRNEKNLGAAWNFNHVFEMSYGEYFKWAAHDDIIAPDYILKCVKVLDNDNSIILCNSRAKFIDKSGKIIADYNISSQKANSPKPQDRFGFLIFFDHWCFDVFGLIRSDYLRRTSLIKAYPGSDRALLAELGLLGRFYEVPEHLFFNREHAERSVRAHAKIRLRAGWFDTSKEGKIAQPQWGVFFQYLRSVNHFPLDLYDKACCYMHIGKWVSMYYRSMAKELIFTFIYYLN